MIGHIDLAFPSAFIDTSGTPQPQAVRTPLELLMRGKRVGLAADTLSILWSTRSAQLAMAQSAVPAAPAVSSAAAAPSPVSTQIAQMTLARDDARNYIVLGDPAARLRVDSLRLSRTSHALAPSKSLHGIFVARRHRICLERGLNPGLWKHPECRSHFTGESWRRH